MIYMSIFKTGKITDNITVKYLAGGNEMEVGEFIEKYPYLLLYDDEDSPYSAVSRHDILCRITPHLDEKILWANETLHGDVMQFASWFGFANREDAILFKLRWT